MQEIQHIKSALSSLIGNAENLATRPPSDADPGIKRELQAIQPQLNEAYAQIQKLIFRYFS